MWIFRWAGLAKCLGMVVITAVTLPILTSCATKQNLSDFYLNPAEGDRAVFNHEGLVVSMRYLDGDEQTQYIRAAGREALAREIKDLPLSAFLLEVTNGSVSEVVVDPGRIRFATGSGPLLSPVGYAQLYMALPRGEGRQTVLSELQSVSFDRPVTVRAGGREEGLIFFQRPETVARDVAVAMDGLYLGGAQLKAVLTFRAVPVEE